MDPLALAFERGFGEALIRLKPRDKKPRDNNWPQAPRMTLETARAWLRQGGNLGLRTGPLSGLFVIDDDRPKKGLPAFAAPPTGLVALSPTGSRHLYYRMPAEPFGNTAGRLAPSVDTRGAGGFVVFPGSRHPSAEGLYRWASTGEPGELPEELLAQLRGAEPAPAPRALPQGEASRRPRPEVGGSRWARAALEREVAKVGQVGEGGRNDALNRAGFALGQLVGGGELARGEVEERLTAAALSAGLPAGEIGPTLRSGIEAGLLEPRRRPEPKARAQRSQPRAEGVPAESPEAPQGGGRADVLIPGAHVLPGGEVVEQGSDTFAEQALAALPPGMLYRTAEQVVEVSSGKVEPVSNDRARLIVDQAARLTLGRPGRGNDPEPEIVFRTCSRDAAGLVLAAALRSPAVPELDLIVTAPVLLPGGEVLAKGYDPGTRTLCHPARAYPEVEAIERNPSPAQARAAWLALLEPLAGFECGLEDQAAAVAVLLSLVARPAIKGNLPLLCITAPRPRIGKTLLANVLGIAATGSPPMLAAPAASEDEWDKRLSSQLKRAPRAVLLDNCRAGEFIESGSLAALITAPEGQYQARELGSSRMFEVRNRALWILTGNNMGLSLELAGRALGVQLTTSEDEPAARRFDVVNLPEHVRAQHPRLLAQALILLRAFLAIGAPQHGGPGLGGFDDWDRLIRSAVIWASTLAGLTLDPVATQERLKRAAVEEMSHGPLLEAWAEAFGEGEQGAKTTAELLAEAKTRPKLRQALEHCLGCPLESLSDPRKLGNYMRTIRDNLLGGRRMSQARAKATGGYARWFLEIAPIWRPRRAGSAGGAE